MRRGIRISTTLGVIKFAIVATVFVTVAAVWLNGFLFSSFFSETLQVNFYDGAYLLTVYICLAVATPVFGTIGLLIKRATLMSVELQRLVERDRLTDVATRDFFFARLTAFPDAYGVSLMVDIDHFKRVNDTYGHMAGDAVISSVAQVMRDEIREQDIVCRFGGEEFIVFLQDTKPTKANEIAERMRSRIQAEIVSTSSGDIAVTVSVGGSIKDRLDDIEDAIARADACLYEAKTSGRNRTVMEWEMNAKDVA